MKTFFRAVAVVAFLLTSQPAVAQSTTFGDPDCGQWINQKSATRQAWLLGFLTGFNMASVFNNRADSLDKLNSGDQAFVWMDNYCRANPLKRVSSGATELYLELMKKSLGSVDIQ